MYLIYRYVLVVAIIAGICRPLLAQDNLQQSAVCKACRFVPVQKAYNAWLVEFTASYTFKLSGADYQKAGDTTLKQYNLAFRFRRADSSFIDANPGYPYCTDDNGKLCVHANETLTTRGKPVYTATLKIPLAAFNLNSRTDTLYPVLSIEETETATPVEVRNGSFPFVLAPKPLRSYDFVLDSLEVDTIDFNNEMWDYFFLKAYEADPDVYWMLDYGAGRIYESPVVKNSFEYFGDPGTDSLRLTICAGDKLQLEVLDFDPLSADDQIGSYTIDPALPGISGLHRFRKTAGKIKYASFRVTPVAGP